MRALLLCLSFVGLLFAVPAAAPPPSAEAEVRAIWVDSFNPGLRSPEEIDALIARVRRANINTIVAQVRRNAQSLYAISLEGWAENYVPPPGFDPLQDLIEKAHARGIEVHAWVNVGPIYSGHPTIATAAWPCMLPCDPSHVFNRHGWGQPDDEYWLTRSHPSHTAGTHADFPGERLSTGLWYLDLGHPAAADYTIDVLLHVIRNYNVDGLHLDFIRYPEMPITSPPDGGLSFATGYNPVSVRRFNAAFARPEGSLPDPWNASWSQWRRDQVSAFVRRLYLETLSLRPRVTLSASLIAFFRGPNTEEPRTFQQTEPYYRVFQDWNGWMEEGMLDLGMPMIYKSQHIASHLVQFREWIEFTKTAQYGRHGTIGLGAFLNSLENTLAQMAEGRAPALTGERSRGFNLFSYNATNQATPDTPLRPQDELFRALSEDGAYAAEAPFRDRARTPTMAWKTRPRRGHLLARIIGADSLPADGARVTIRRFGGSPDEKVVQYADGNGFVGGIALVPGAYWLIVEVAGAPRQRITVRRLVVPGRVTRVTVTLDHQMTGPIARDSRILAAQERTDHLEGASPLEEWRTHEPLADDVAAENAVLPRP
ncbi:MAG: family 10 glycosylhydrolase [Vicinamibacteraceae bacterium]